MAKQKPQRGRPPKPPEERRSAELRIRLTEAERARLDQAAAAHESETSTWARGLLLGTAERITEAKGGSKSGRAKRP
jgi:hypothetical protein